MAILCPIQNTDVKAVVNKKNLFGANPSMYKKLKFNGRPLKGHEGIDLVVPIGTVVFAPIEGTIEVFDNGGKGYGLHVVITNDRFKIILGHLAGVHPPTGAFVPMGGKIALSGNSGNSTGPHLHITVMRMKDGKIQDLDNGFGGAINVIDDIITWKGTLTKDTI